MTKSQVAEYIKLNSRNNFLYVKYSYKQLGRSEEWFESQCRDLNQDELAIRREVLLEWIRSTDLSPFSSKDLDRLSRNVHDSIGTIFIKKYYPFNVYIEPDLNERYLIGGDFSGGLERDNTSLIVCRQNGEIVMSFKNNIVDAPETAEIIYELMDKLLPNSILVPERNSYGLTVIDILLRTKIANRIYYEKKEVKGEKKVTSTYDTATGKFYTKVYGVNTDKTSRPKLIDLIPNIIKNEYGILHSDDVIRDIQGLQRNKKGKIEHSSDGHDDCLFAYLCVRYILRYGTNLKRFNINMNLHIDMDTDVERGEKIKTEKEIAQSMARVTLLNKNLENNAYKGIYDDFMLRKFSSVDQFSVDRRSNTAKNISNIFSLNKK